jgi:hypothetical protein
MVSQTGSPQTGGRGPRSVGQVLAALEAVEGYLAAQPLALAPPPVQTRVRPPAARGSESASPSSTTTGALAASWPAANWLGWSRSQAPRSEAALGFGLGQ